MLRYFLLLIIISTSYFVAQAQPLVRDTTYLSGHINKIVSTRNGKKFGPTFSYYYSPRGSMQDYKFYINDQLYGLSIHYHVRDIPSAIYCWVKGESVFSQTFINGRIHRSFIGKEEGHVHYDSLQNIQDIYYPTTNESVILHSNQQVKSIILCDSSIAPSKRYYEFSEEGVLVVEGILADTFAEVMDTIVLFDTETTETITSVLRVQVPLKHGEWFYYSNKGILEERKTYHYFSDRKGKTTYIR